MICTIEEAKEKVIAAGIKLLETGLIARTWGNISARISETEFVITPSGRPYTTLTPDDIVTVKIADASWEGDVKPSSEKGVHAAAYRQRPDAGFVIHTHQEYATALSTLGDTFRVKQADQASLSLLGPEVPTARYGMASTKTLTKHVEDALKEHPQSRTVLMRNHGTLCLGKDDAEAFLIAERLESACRLRYRRLVSLYWPRHASEDLPLSSYANLLHREIHEEYDQRYLIFDDPSINAVLETRAPFIRQMSFYGKPMPSYLDDLAQMAGPQIRCLPPDASDKVIARAVKGGGMVLIRGFGAICAAGSADDAEAMMLVLNKGCQAALLAEAGCNVKPVGTIHGMIDHFVYIRKYSKLAKEDSDAEETDD